MKPAQRMSAQKSLRTPYTSAKKALQSLANPWPYSFQDDFVAMLHPDFSCNHHPINFSFYRTVQELKALSGQTDMDTPFNISSPEHASHVSFPIPTCLSDSLSVLKCYNVGYHHYLIIRIPNQLILFPMKCHLNFYTR
jgi:hypothetical protein